MLGAILETVMAVTVVGVSMKNTNDVLKKSAQTAFLQEQKDTGITERPFFIKKSVQFYITHTPNGHFVKPAISPRFDAVYISTFSALSSYVLNEIVSWALTSLQTLTPISQKVIEVDFILMCIL